MRLAGQYGAVDKTGKTVITPQFTGMSQFVDGVADVGMEVTALGFGVEKLSIPVSSIV